MDRIPNGVPSSYRQGEFCSSRSDRTTTFRRFSPSRRLFCLFAAFDFLFTLLAWVIYAHIFTRGIKKSLRSEVVNYSIETSLFDLVLLALWRMVVLLLVYALFHSRQWYAIAFDKSQGNSMAYLEVIMTFVLCWSEAWLLDFKVIPAELKAENRYLSESMETAAGERRPLLNGQSSEYNTRSWITEHSTFYTPYGSQPGSGVPSEDEDEAYGDELSSKDKAFKQQAKEVFMVALNLLNSSGVNWKLEKEKNGIIVESCIQEKTGKLFRVQCSIDAPPVVVFSLIVLRVEDGSKWNSSVIESRVLHKIDKCTDICYNVTAETAGGMVSSRDFVNLRHWQKRGNAYISCNVSVEYDQMPPVKQYVRGENHPGGWMFAEKDGHHDKTDFVMMVNTDLKGWLPQYLIDQAMTGVLLDTADCLRRYVTSVNEEQRPVL
ncbi:stAR-related lipid transfer protein 3 isoform X2 [Exaiptasia diaphana]|uniref:StAR-related lipid transfer protein 3 n=1 Tax=Exaiptasia diaphana TaxID=2652724 RepID=A0A913YTV7_EXADI|nr:stAR-related lipid transfer protein 3 isoform X2 [Exaiptasia diaphana]